MAQTPPVPETVEPEVAAPEVSGPAVKPLKVKRFFRRLLSHCNRVTWTPEPQGTVTQPTMCFKCFLVFDKSSSVYRHEMPPVTANPLFPLN